MKKAEFLQELEERLRVLNDQERQDVLDEYVQHIDMKTAAGMSEEEAVGDFGDLDELITDLLDAYHVNSEYAAGVSGRAYKRSAAGAGSRTEDEASGQETGSYSENAGDAEESAGRGLGNAVKNAGHGLGSAAKSVGRGLGSAAQNVGHGLGNAAKGVGHGLGSAAKGVGRGLGSAAKTAGRGAGSAAKASGRGLRVLLKKGTQAAKQFCLACWNVTKRAGRATAHAARSLWGLFVRFLLWIAAVVRGVCSAVKRGVRHIFYGKGQEQWMPSAEAGGQDPNETGKARMRQARRSARSGQRSLLYRIAAWTGRILRSLCVLCVKAVLLAAALPFVMLELIALFGAGMALVLLVQGYPVIGVTVVVFGAVLCLFGISALILSLVFTGKHAGNDVAEIPSSVREYGRNEVAAGLSTAEEYGRNGIAADSSSAGEDGKAEEGCKESQKPLSGDVFVEAQGEAAPSAQPSDTVTGESEGRNQDELS